MLSGGEGGGSEHAMQREKPAQRASQKVTKEWAVDQRLVAVAVAVAANLMHVIWAVCVREGGLGPGVGCVEAEQSYFQ